MPLCSEQHRKAGRASQISKFLDEGKMVTREAQLRHLRLAERGRMQQ